MTNLVITAEELDTERRVILEERRLRVDNNPSAILSEQANAALFMNHPYRRPIIGWEHEIRAIGLNDVLQFYRRWYTPKNAILVVAGDITAKQLRPLAERTYGKIPAAAARARKRPSEPPQKARRQITLRDARVRQPSWSRTVLAPSYTAGEAEHAYALEVLAEILGGGATSRVYRALVVEGKLAVSAGAYYSADPLGPARFSFYASPRPGVTMGAIEAAMDALVEKLLRDGVSDDEVARAKKRMQTSAVYARDSLSTGARVLGSALASGRTVEDVETWPESIGAVDAARVDAAARAVIENSRSVTSLLLPEKD
jgi:zinc protease